MNWLVLFVFLPFCYCIKKSEFHKKTNFGYRSLDGLSVSAKSGVECAAICMHQDYCSSWYYNTVSTSCNIDTHYAVTPITDPQNDWMFYEETIGLNNVAVNKPTTISSVYQNDNLKQAFYAVDGVVPPNSVGGNYCAHTDRENPAWWQVDLQSEYNICKVILVNRNDDLNVGKRLRNFDVHVITDAGQTLLCGHFADASIGGETIELMCSNKPKGRYVKVTLRETDYLTLCEVEAYTWL